MRLYRIFLIITLFLATQFFLASAYAQENVTPSATLTPTPMQTDDQVKGSSDSAVVNYDLAFPGMLPDNPLYKLKVLKDKITLALISDPKRKIDFYLLQTDKGVLATAMLVDKKEYALAGETALKAENNYTLLTQELYNLPSKPNQDFYKRLQLAALKHQQVLEDLLKRVPANKQKDIRSVIDFSKRNWQSIEDYKVNVEAQ